MHKVDYSSWNRIQSARHNITPKFQIPPWFIHALLVTSLIATVALVIKVLMYQPSEHLTLEPVNVDISPIKLTFDVKNENGHVTIDGGTSVKPAPSVKGSTGTYCPEIDFPTVPQGTQCIAIRKSGSITLTCGDQQVHDIPTLQCLFEKLPKDTFDVSH